MVKRIFDLIIAIAGSLIFAPLALLISLLIKLESSGPAVISTLRTGKDGLLFHHYRFRTMAGNPPKKTRLGKWIGNLSLDDLPTLYNVLKGDLSIVGPRPESPDKVDLNDPEWRKVLSIKPGLTGLGLLTSRDTYNETSIKDRLEPEIFYVENSSLLFDIQLLSKTLYWWLRMGHIKGRFY